MEEEEDEGVFVFRAESAGSDAFQMVLRCASGESFGIGENVELSLGCADFPANRDQQQLQAT